jgi:photosystem II stability/assembly factor-like uncharacterized protein
MLKKRSTAYAALGLLLCGPKSLASTPISDAVGNARRPQMAYSAGLLHLVDFEDQDIVYYRSADRGRSFGPPVVIGDGSTRITDWNPALAAAQNYVYIAYWSEPRANDVFEVYLTRSTNGGLSFETPQLLSLDDRRASYVTGVASSADGSRVVVAYWDLRTVGGRVHSNLFTRTSNSHGAAGSWGPEVLASDADRVIDYQSPRVVLMADGRIVILYQGSGLGYPVGGLTPYEVLVTMSLDGGQTYFRELSFVSAPRPTDFATAIHPDCVVDARGVLHAAWYETTRGRNIFYSKSDSGGLIWTPPLQVSTHQPFESLNADLPRGRPGIVANGDRVEIYWAQPLQNLAWGDGGGPIFRAVSTDFGASFGAQSVVVSNNTSSHAAVAGDGIDTFLAFGADIGTGRSTVLFDVVPSVVVPLHPAASLALLAGFSLLLARVSTRRKAVSARALLGAMALGLAAPSGAQAPVAVLSLGAEAATVNDLYRTSSGILLAATEGGGVFRSSDNGQNWVASSQGLGNRFVSGLDGDGSNLVLAGTQQGLYRSTDAGQSWQRRIGGRVSSVRVTPGQPGTCYAGALGGGVLRSTDGGQTWRSAGIAGLGAVDVTTLDVGGGRVWVGTPGQGVHVSTDSGSTWQRRTSGLESFVDASYVSRLRVDPQDSNIVYLGSQGALAPASLNIQGGDVYITRNAGASWQRHNTQESFYGVEGLSIGGGGRLFAGTDQIGLYATQGSASGGSFSKILPATHARDAVTDSAGQNIWVALQGAGVYRSSDGGASFVPSSRGLRAAVVRDVAVQGSTVLLGGPGGILRSTNRGTTFAWSNVGMGQNGNSLAVDILAIAAGSQGRVYASSRFDGFLVSDNGGASWVRRDPPDTAAMHAIAIGATRDHVVVGRRDGKLSVSANGGLSWTEVSLGESKAFVSSISIDPGNPSAMLVASFNQRSFATSNGTSFSVIQQPTSEEYRFALLRVLTLPSANLQVAASSEGMMNRPLTYGATPPWTRRLGGLQDSYFSAVLAHPQSQTRLVAAAYGGGLYSSQDGGMNWRKVSAELGNLYITSLASLDSSSLVVGTLAGAYSVSWP